MFNKARSFTGSTGWMFNKARSFTGSTGWMFNKARSFTGSTGWMFNKARSFTGEYRLDAQYGQFVQEYILHTIIRYSTSHIHLGHYSKMFRSD